MTKFEVKALLNFVTCGILLVDILKANIMGDNLMLTLKKYFSIAALSLTIVGQMSAGQTQSTAAIVAGGAFLGGILYNEQRIQQRIQQRTQQERQKRIQPERQQERINQTTYIADIIEQQEALSKRLAEPRKLALDPDGIRSDFKNVYYLESYWKRLAAGCEADISNMAFDIERGFELCKLEDYRAIAKELSKLSPDDRIALVNTLKPLSNKNNNVSFNNIRYESLDDLPGRSNLSESLKTTVNNIQNNYLKSMHDDAAFLRTLSHIITNDNDLITNDNDLK